MDDTAPAALRVRAEGEAQRLRAEGLFSDADARRLDAAFERAAVRALRAPDPIERSVLLRRMARRMLPARLRPVVGRVVRAVEHRLRAAAGARGA